MRFSKFSAKIALWLGAIVVIFSTALIVEPSDANAATISQTPQTGATTVDGSTLFTDVLITSGSSGGETFLATGGAGEASFNINNATGAIATTSQLAVGTYIVTGTDTDTSLDTGTWSYTLTVTPSTISQTPQTGATNVAGSASFEDQLVTTGSNLTESFTATGGTGESSFNVGTTGVIITTGQQAAGVYTVTGTDTDTQGDTGTWSYTLTVTSPSSGPPPPPSATTLVQTSSTTGAATTDNSASFTAGPITVSHATGTVTFFTTSSSPALSVSAQGNIITTGPLAVGNYSVSGTDSDPSSDTGTWLFSLTVNTSITVKFVANGGQGTMALETKTLATALSPNVFTWSKHVFDDWNTAVDGSGASYANGADYSFTVSTTLYAQWTATTHVVPSHKVTFDANGGTGSMKTETKNVLASLTTSSFTRKGFQFVNWNTAANGLGTSYDNGGAYKFNKSTTLYAQWRAAAVFSVKFHANGGTGSMKTETKKSAAPLTLNKFTRTGFKFIKWSTTGNGLSGFDYANGQSFNFKASLTLYAQWSAVKAPPVPPAIDAVVSLSPFGVKSSALSTGLESQITALANEIQTNHDTKISLTGYSGDLTTANATNESDWAASLKLSQQRAFAVEEYLKLQLARLGITGYTISAVGNAAALPPSANATAADQARNRKVVAKIA
jgi:outer membrane protein OmpA-like peptidoglycan-associated protein